MSIEQSKDLALRCFAAMNDQDLAGLAATMSPKWAAEISGWFPRLARTWAGHRIEVVDMVAEGDRVWCRLRTSGEHRGEWHGIPPTGRSWTNTGIWYLQIAEGKIVEVEWLMDEMSLARQFGATLAPEPSALSYS